MRWKATITHLTHAGGVRTWEGEIEAATVEEACERASRLALQERPGVQITDLQVERVRGSA